MPTADAYVPIGRGEHDRDAVVRACSYAPVVGADTGRSAALAGSSACNNAPLPSGTYSTFRSADTWRLSVEGDHESHDPPRSFGDAHRARRAGSRPPVGDYQLV
jgi:hypothetical protein